MKNLLILSLLILTSCSFFQKLRQKEEVLEIFSVSTRAEFPGGDEGLQKFLAENVKYPAMAMENDVQGTVIVMFVIDKKGNVSDIAIMNKKLGNGLEEEAIRVIKLTSGKWTPAMQRDKPVSIRFRIPIKFQLF